MGLYSNSKLKRSSRSIRNRKSLGARIIKYRHFYLMFLPVFLFYAVFHYAPMYGISYAFRKITVFGAGEYIGLENFKRMFNSTDFWNSFFNTLILSGIILVLGMVVTLTFALLLNEIRTKTYKKFIQTAVYLPHFLSWVVVAAVFYLILSVDSGVVNQIIKFFGGKKIFFMVSEDWWRPIFIIANRWKETGWAAVIYIAALANVDPQLYEAAVMDGAGKLKQVWHITLPAIATTVLTVFILDCAKIMNIFESVFAFQNPSVTSIAEVIQIYAYRIGIQNGDYGYATAIGLFKSVIALVLVIITNKLSKRIRGESIL